MKACCWGEKYGMMTNVGWNHCKTDVWGNHNKSGHFIGSGPRLIEPSTRRHHPLHAIRSHQTDQSIGISTNTNTNTITNTDKDTNTIIQRTTWSTAHQTDNKTMSSKHVSNCRQVEGKVGDQIQITDTDYKFKWTKIQFWEAAFSHANTEIQIKMKIQIQFCHRPHSSPWHGLVSQSCSRQEWQMPETQKSQHFRFGNPSTVSSEKYQMCVFGFMIKASELE